MQPFFSYRFYTFDDVFSPHLQGNNPQWQHRKQFDVDDTAEFIAYMRKQTFKIDFIDESVDMTQKNLRDYIGSARIPLSAVFEKKEFIRRVTVVDEMQRNAGEVDISIRILDATEMD
jgi:hypothetical protein